MAEEKPITPMSTASTLTTCPPRSNISASNSTPTWHERPPFEKNRELCKDLDYVYSNHAIPQEGEKIRRLHSRGSFQTLPDAPRIPLASQEIIPYCLSDLDTPRLNQLGEKLWWVGPEPVLKSLSEQTTLERKISVTEDPNMHCIWTENITFLKPLPAYLCSFAFWEYLLDSTNSSISPEQREKLRATALGFLQTYARLIRHKSDFNLGVKLDLLPSPADYGFDFESFIQFIMAFDALPDSAISVRWRFGELVLGALNFHSAIHLRRWHLNRYERRYGTYFERLFPVVLFMFALFSVALSAMQVIVGARQFNSDDRRLNRTMGFFIWFGTEAAAWSAVFGAVFVVWWIGISSAEAWRRHKMKRRMQAKARREGSRVPC